MTWAIQTEQLTKRFPKSPGWRLKTRELEPPAVDHVDLSIRDGELFGLLGPNGAGKTTLIKLLCTLILPTSGRASLFGYDLHQEDEIRAQIGLVTSDERSFFWRLTGRQNLDFFASLNGLYALTAKERVNSVLRQVDLLDVADKQFQVYSTGMRQRLAIARALLKEPQILFLDEPTRGLDPNASSNLHELIRSLARNKEKTIFLTTHDLNEASDLCDRIAIMDDGKILACGTIAELQEQIKPSDEFELHVEGLPSNLIDKLRENVSDLSIQPLEEDFSQKYIIHLKDPKNNYYQLNTTIDILRKSKTLITQINHRSASLQNVFKYLTEKEQPGNEELKTEWIETNHFTKIEDSQPQKRIEPKQHTSSWFSGIRTPLAFLKRDWLIESSYRISFLLQVISIFFSVTMFYFIAQLFGESADAYLTRYNTDYFSFVLIGIAFSGYFGVGLSSFSSRLRQAQTTGTLEAMLTTPTKHTTIIFSSSLWDYLWTTIRTVIYLIIGILFMGVSFKNANYASATLILILSLISFSSLGIIAASFIMVLKRGDPVTWIVSSLSSLLGGVYYPVKILPTALQWLSLLVPLTFTLDAMRLSLLSGKTIVELIPQISALILYSIVLIPVGLIAFHFAVQKAKKDGSLTQY